MNGFINDGAPLTIQHSVGSGNLIIGANKELDIGGTGNVTIGADRGQLARRFRLFHG